VQNAWRIGIGAAVVVAAVVLFLVLRGRDDDSSTNAAATGTVATSTEETPTTPVETTAPTDTAPAETTPTDTAPANPTFRVNVPAEGPSSVQRLDAKQGQQVTIVVTTGDHWNIHLHGYDILLHTGPGLPPAKFQFRADTPGSFEMEIEDTETPIAELRVNP
jgi:hypothetical protein